MASVPVDERILAVLPDLYTLGPAAQFLPRILDVACRLLDGEKAVYSELNRKTGVFRTLVRPSPPELTYLDEARAAFMHQHPVLRRAVRGGVRASRTITDFVSPPEFRRMEIYGEFFAPLGVSDQITVVIATPLSELLAGVSVDRGSNGFHDADRLLLDMLRPHLEQAFQNAVRYASALRTPLCDTDLNAASSLERLTDRQLEILRLISAGSTNQQIARELGLSAQTVRKHVENILSRMNVTNRTTAAIQYVRGSLVHPELPWSAELEWPHLATA